MKKKLLLSDEIEISERDYEERELLEKEFKKMPEDFFSKLRHFQPQVGCLNGCKICSKKANSMVEFWTVERIRNIIAALKYSSPQKESNKSIITYDRKEHRNSVVFPYLDNDVGNYPYLEEFIKIAFRELGVTTRISSVGFSRYNNELNKMHKKINLLDEEGLGGVRLSFTPYEIGWVCSMDRFSKTDYILDMANYLNIYKPYYEKAGSGSREMCCEIRYKPLAVIKEVYDTNVLNHKVIAVGNYLFVSRDVNAILEEAEIKDPYDHGIVLDKPATKFYMIDLYKEFESIESLKKTCYKFIVGNLADYELVDVFLMKNFDGIYYAVNPSLYENGNYGINIYPRTESRNTFGYIITERFLVNSIIEYKHSLGMKSLDLFETATWDDVYNVLKICRNDAKIYKSAGKLEKYSYIINDVLPIINAYITALQISGYGPDKFFDAKFTIDTGIICNLGRAVGEFKGLTMKENEPLTPVHERNYGVHNSKMSMEGVAWRLSCDYNNTLVIEKLNMFDTASVRGQVAEKKIIKLNENLDEVYKSSDLAKMYLVPGQRLI